MKINTNRWLTNKSCFSTIVLLLISLLSFQGTLLSQIAYSTSFDGCNAASCSSWTISGGSTPSITSTTASNYSPCNTASAKVNIYGSATTGTLVSTASLGTSTGMPATLGMSYKCINYAAGAAVAAGNCTFTASWATTASGPWTTISSFTNVSSTSCTSTSFSAFTPTVGQPVFIRIVAVRSAGDFWAVMDNISLTQASSVACTGTPSAGTAAITAATGCAGTSFTLSATGVSSAGGIGYQWQSSSTSSGPWTDIASATSTSLTTTATATTYYRLVTTCSNSSLTNTSSVISYTVSCFSMPTSGTTSYTTCSGTVYDPGGTGNYANNASSIMTIYPATAGNVVSLSFSAFATESGYDGLVIYNGNNTSASIISSGLAVGGNATNCPAGSFYGSTSPGTITSSAADGSLTLQFKSDGSTVGAGFTAAISCAPPASYLGSWVSMSTGSANWCAGETRTVSVTVKNAGSQAWTNSSPDINIAVKWATDAAYVVKANANGLASGSTQTFSFSLTAPTTMGFNSLNFDIINEGNCNFSSNSGTCGPGNITYTSATQFVQGTPVANAGPDVATTCGLPVTINGVATPVNTTLLKEDFEAATTGLVDPTLSNWTEVFFSGAGYSYWSINSICPLVGTKSLTLADLWSYTDCDYDQTDALQFGAAYDLPINGTNYTNLKLNFKWKGVGQAGQDYAQVMYSLDGLNWTTLPTIYNGQSTMQTVSNLDLSALNGQQFYIGFFWRNNASVAGTQFVVDDIILTGDVIPTYAWSPSTNLSATNIINPVATPPATTTYTLTASMNGCSSTDQVVVNFQNPSVAPTSVSGGTVACVGNAVTLTANGATLPPGGAYEWFSASCGGTVVAGTGPSITVLPTASTTYYARVGALASCPATACANGTVTLPAAGTTLSNDNESATCVVTENNFIHFYHSSGRLLASINSNGQNLGNVSVTSYLEAGPIGVASCENSSQITSVLSRHWVITPQFQPASPVTLRLPFDNSAEFGALVSDANTNSNPLDDIAGMASLKLSKYSGPANVDNIASNNCTAAGGSGGTTLLQQTDNGNVSSYVSGFSGDAKFLEFSIPGFSEFWLHGDQSTSPLPVELTNFSADCSKADHVNIAWSTASESNSQKFIVEKSRDMNYWEQVKELPAAGSSNFQLDYSAKDYQAFTGVSYYRLIQVDNNGESKIYGPISASCSNELNSMTAFPNPSKANFTVEISSTRSIGNTEIQLTDLAGKVISTRMVNIHEGTNQVLFDGSDLQLGTYIVSVVSQSEFKPVRVVIH